MRFDHHCTISREMETDEFDEWGNPAEVEAMPVYSGPCQVYDDETMLKQIADGDKSLIGRSAVRLQYRPQTAPKQGDTVGAVFNGETRTGMIEAISALAHYPRLQVRWL